jgi:hypothetical protein
MNDDLPLDLIRDRGGRVSSPATKLGHDAATLAHDALLVPMVLVAALVQVHSAAAGVITQCGASSGVTYYFEGGAIGADKAGWKKDGVTGSFELVANADNREADIIYENPPPIGPSSYRAEGATVTYGRRSWLVIAGRYHS